MQGRGDGERAVATRHWSNEEESQYQDLLLKCRSATPKISDSKSLSCFIMENKLGLRYPQLAGAIRFGMPEENTWSDWRDGGVRNDCYARLCEDLDFKKGSFRTKRFISYAAIFTVYQRYRHFLSERGIKHAEKCLNGKEEQKFKPMDLFKAVDQILKADEGLLSDAGKEFHSSSLPLDIDNSDAYLDGLFKDYCSYAR